MTRMWCLNPRLLCRQHLLGEHNELHKLVGGIRNHPHGEAIADGQAEKGNIDTSRINDRHAQLAEELERRGFNHDSPLEYRDDEYQAGIGVIDREANADDLADRCADCRNRLLSIPVRTKAKLGGVCR